MASLSFVPGRSAQNPVSWPASSEGGRMIGYMVQRRHLDGDSDGFDLKGRCSGGVAGGGGGGGGGRGGGLVLPSATRAALLELDSVHIRPSGNYPHRTPSCALVPVSRPFSFGCSCGIRSFGKGLLEVSFGKFPSTCVPPNWSVVSVCLSGTMEPPRVLVCFRFLYSVHFYVTC